jgi:hypothetical protein
MKIAFNLRKGAWFFIPLAWLMGMAACDATPDVTIVLPPSPTRVEKFAAAELGKYLAAATGAKTTLADGAPPSGVVFFVGNLGGDPARLTQKGFPPAKLDDSPLVEDGIDIESDGRQTLLVGKGERGALNAVYTYLEDVIGCHWPEPEREFVPHLSNWTPQPVHRVVNPQFPWRGMANRGATKEYFLKVVDWLGKNRLNAFQIFPNLYANFHPYLADAIADRGLMLNVGAHSREFFLPTKKYQADHPEWFALEKGKRTNQLDYANFDSIPAYVAGVVAFLKQNPEIKIVSLWPNDGYGFNAMTAKDRNATDVLLTYINQLAAGIHAEVPDVQCEFLAYVVYTAAPLSTKPDPYVMPTFCEHYGSIGARDHWHPITDNRAANQRLREELVKWIACSKQVTEFSYYGDDCIKRYLYHPLEDVVVADCHYYRSIGLAGDFDLITASRGWWANSATTYAYARAMWDAGVTAEQIKADYYASLYGAAAGAMRRHAEEVEALYDISPAGNKPLSRTLVGAIDISGKDYPSVLAQYAAGIARAHRALAEAAALTPDLWIQGRIDKLQSDTDYLDLWFQIQCGEQHLSQARSAELKAHVLALIDQALKNEVVAVDDAKGWQSANQALHAAHNRVAAIVCDQP